MKTLTKSTSSTRNTNILLPRSDLRIPAYARKYEELKGICIGGCVVKGYGKNYDGQQWYSRRIDEKEVAHAHCVSAGVWFGWICSPYKLILTNKWLLKHELAHLIAEDETHKIGHTKKWKETLLMIGGSLDAKSLTKKWEFQSYR